MKNTYQWQRVESRVLPNLHVLNDGNLHIGMVQKPADSKGDKNLWRCFKGVGEQAELIGHRKTLGQAKATVEVVCFHETRSGSEADAVRSNITNPVVKALFDASEAL